MDDWDDEVDGGVVATKVSSCWDENELDAVPDSWDAEEVKPVPAPATTKVSVKEKIRLREERQRMEREEKLKREEEARQSQQMTELQRERLAEEAELSLLNDTFGNVKATEVVATRGSIDLANPLTKEDFNQLNELIRDKLSKLENSPHYSAFAETIIRDASTGMDLESLKSVSAVLNALLIEKQKLVKGKSKKKAKGKLVVERENDYDYGDDAAADEFDDFM